MRDRFAFGILGTGNIARQFANGVNASRRCKLVAVGSRTVEAAQAFAAGYGVAGAYGSYEELVNDPAVQAVYVSLPNSMHHEWTIRALRAGKHVLCEKPIATSVAQAEEMFDEARRAGRVLMEAFMYRTHPLTRAVVETVRSGAIGEVRLIRTSFCFKVGKTVGNIRFSPELAGGVVMDVGCYCVNFSRLMAGAEPSAVHVVGRRHASGVDEIAAGTLSFPNGVIATFSCGMSVHADNTSSVCGSEGYVEVPVPWKPPAKGAVYVVGRSVPPRMDDPNARPGPAVRETRVVEGEGELYGMEADAFAACVLDGVGPAVSREDSIGNQRVLDEIRRQLGA